MTEVAELALFTDDVAAVVSFYRGLLGAAPFAEWAGGAIFAVGDAKLLVHERAAAMDDGPPNEDHFALSVVDLEVAYAEIGRTVPNSSWSRATTSGADRRTCAIPTAGSSSSRRRSVRRSRRGRSP
ncbi:MAG: VOC family protein [Gaiellaceae bacterium]